MRLTATAVLGCCAILLAASVCTAQTPEPSPSASTLPEIGRTRARPLCNALRTSVAPSIVNVQTGDQKFAEARTVMVATLTRTSGTAEVEGSDLQRTAKLDALVAAMGTRVKEIKAILDTPEMRAAAMGEKGHGETKALADVQYALGAMLESQEVQLNAVSSFLQMQQRTQLSNGTETDRSFAGVIGTGAAGGRYGRMPSYSAGKMPLHDAKQLEGWLTGIATTTDRREALAGRIIVAAAALCR